LQGKFVLEIHRHSGASRNSGIDRAMEGKDTLGYCWYFRVIQLKFLFIPERAPYRHSVRRLR